MRNKIILIIALFIGVIGFSQNPAKFKDGIETKAVHYKELTTVQRDAIVIKAGNHPKIYNTTTSQFEYWNGSAWVADSIGGGSLEVKDEAISTVAAATILNFVGSAVTVTDAGAGEATITIVGGSGESTTVSDTPEINMTLTGSDITSDIVLGSIDETKLDASTNISLNLADTALQSFTETDPIYTAWDKSTGISITESQISDLTHTTNTTRDIASVLEIDTGTDNVKTISPLGLAGSQLQTAVTSNNLKVGITPTQASNITTNNAKISYTDATAVGLNTAKVSFPGFTSLLADYSFTDNSSNWDNAFNWGNHSLEGYVTTADNDLNTTLANGNLSNGLSAIFDQIGGGYPRTTVGKFEIELSQGVGAGDKRVLVSTTNIQFLQNGGGNPSTWIENDAMYFSHGASTTLDVRHDNVVSDVTLQFPNQGGTIAVTTDITGTNSGTNTGDNSINTLYSGLVTFPGFTSLLSDYGYTEPTHELSDLTDVDITVGSPTDGKIMVYRSAGSDWILEDKPIPGGGGAAQLNELSDVNTSTPTNRNVLVADGVDFESRALVEADISNLGTYSTDIHSNITALNSVSNTNTGDNAVNTQYSGLISYTDAAAVSANSAKITESTTVSDTPEIDMTLTGFDITSDIVVGSVDVLKLDAGVQTSLGLADTALQSFTEVDGSITNEIQTIDVSQLVGTDLQLSLSSDGETTKVIDLSSLQDGSGTVTSVTIESSSNNDGISISGSPITTTGTYDISTNFTEFQTSSVNGDAFQFIVETASGNTKKVNKTAIILSEFVDDLTHTTNTNLDIATVGEIDTGTDNTKAISPLGLAGSQLQTDVTANNLKVGITPTQASDITANNSKVTNVTTNLTEGTATTTTVDVNSSDGTNATLIEASTTRAGVLSKTKFDEIVVNTAKDLSLYKEKIIATTAQGGNTAEDGTNTWSKLATYNINVNSADANFIYALGVYGQGNSGSTIINVFVRRSGDVNSLSGTTVNIISSSNDFVIGSDSFKLTYTDATDIELWVQKKVFWGRISVSLINESSTGDYTTYYYNSPWQSAEPIGSGGNIRASGVLSAMNNTIEGTVESTGFKITAKSDLDVVLAGGGTALLSGIGGASPLTTKGDLFGYDTVDARIPVGADGTFLKANSAVSLGVEWATPAGSGNVSTSGSPVLNDFAKFINSTDIEGRSYAETRVDLGLIIGADVQAFSTVLNNTTASFTSALSANITTNNGKISYTDAAAVGLNTAKVSADGLVTTHSDVTSAGSGIIISAAERDAITVLATSSTTLDLGSNTGNFVSMASANSGTTYTTTGTVTGGWAQVLINTTSQPTVTGATNTTGATWVTGTNMYMVVWDSGTRVEYYFLEI